MLSNLLVLIAELVRWTPGGRLPAVHQCCQKRGRCFPSGSSLNINGLPYWGVVLSTPQEGPHGRAAIRAALPQGEKLDRRPRPPIAEEPSNPAKPSRTCGQTSRGGAQCRPAHQMHTSRVEPGVGPTKEAAFCHILLLNASICATEGEQ